MYHTKSNACESYLYKRLTSTTTVTFAMTKSTMKKTFVLCSFSHVYETNTDKVL